MLDFIKADIIGPSVEELKNHPLLLGFHGDFNEKTGETYEDRLVAEYRFIKFIIIKGKYIRMQGSLHKYFTDGINYNDYTFENIIETLHDLSTVFKINLKKSTLHNLEYSANVNLNYSPQEINNNIINHAGSSFEKMHGKARNTGKQCYKQQYLIKAYNKSFQCKLIGQNIFRLEIKVTKMKYLEKFGIKNLYDLANINKLKKLKQDLILKVNEILIFDFQIKMSNVKRKDKRILEEGRYPKYWELLKKDNKKKYDYTRRRFRELNKIYGNNNQTKLVSLFENKLEFLLKETKKSLAILTELNTSKIEINEDKSLAKLTEYKNEKLSQFNYSSNRLKTTKKCKWCGAEIKGRKNIAIYCSIICKDRAKDYGRSFFKKLDKSCKRNTNEPTLFNTDEYLKLNPMQIELKNRHFKRLE